MNKNKVFAIMLSLGLASSAQAAIQTFTVNGQYGSDYLAVDFTLEQTVTDVVNVTATVANGYFADLRGIYMDLNPNVAFTFSGSDITNSSYGLDTVSVDPFSGSSSAANISGSLNGTTFDLALAIGTNGIGSDDISSTTFTLTGAGLDLSDFANSDWGVRATSVGTSASSRSGSSKIYNGGITPVPGAPVPEPSTYAMFGTAFAILGFFGYRSRSRRS